jgi:hypothetical protein
MGENERSPRAASFDIGRVRDQLRELAARCEKLTKSAHEGRRLAWMSSKILRPRFNPCPPAPVDH